MIEGEELLADLEIRCQALHTVFKGKLKVTTYQVTFAPLKAGARKRKNMRLDFFQIPYGIISR
jgi:hypothetical protein